MEKAENKKDWHLMEFYSPIMEFTEVAKEGFEPDFLIKGVAISETTTHNNHKYIAEELQKATASMIGKPLLVDHSNTIESIKGRVTDALFDVAAKHIKFEAKVMDKQIKEMIKDGRISNVSIGAFAEDLVHEEKTGAYIAKGIKIAELSLVAVPADENACFAMAMANNYGLKEAMESEKKKCPDCGKMIEKDKMKKHMQDMHESYSESEISIERREGEMTEENKLTEQIEANKKLMEEVTALRNEKRQNLISEYKKLCVEKKVGEKDVSKVSEETISLLMEQVKEIKVAEKIETKSVVSEPAVEGIDNFMVEKSNKGYAIWAMPDKSGRFNLK